MNDLTESELAKLQLVILPCHGPIKTNGHSTYNSAYRLWDHVWSETLNDLDGVKKLFSNDFTRHDYATVLLRDGVAISLICCSEANLKLEARKNDSWFECWPSNTLLEISKREGIGLIGAWFCVAPEYRKTRADFPVNIGQVVMESFGKLVLEGKYNVGFGVSRNNRSVNKVVYGIGGVKVGEASAHGCDVDLILVEPEIVREKQLSYSNILKRLWDNKIDYRMEGYEQQLSKTA